MFALEGSAGCYGERTCWMMEEEGREGGKEGQHWTMGAQVNTPTLDAPCHGKKTNHITNCIINHNKKEKRRRRRRRRRVAAVYERNRIHERGGRSRNGHKWKVMTSREQQKSKERRRSK